VRTPDLAVMKLAASFVPQALDQRFTNIYLIARDLDKPDKIRKRYYNELQSLRRLIPQAIPIVQSNIRGNNDALFYQRLGWGQNFASLSRAVSERGRGVVISVRLHGSLQSLISGCPSVHLSYERKGFGAYEDLGLRKYVHAALNF